MWPDGLNTIQYLAIYNNNKMPCSLKMPKLVQKFAKNIIAQRRSKFLPKWQNWPNLVTCGVLVSFSLPYYLIEECFYKSLPALKSTKIPGRRTSSYTFFKYGPIPASFSFIFVHFHITNQLQIEKSVDGVLGIRTRGRSMVGANKTTELWWPPARILYWVKTMPGYELFYEMGHGCIKVPKYTCHGNQKHGTRCTTSKMTA